MKARYESSIKIIDVFQTIGIEIRIGAEPELRGSKVAISRLSRERQSLQERNGLSLGELQDEVHHLISLRLPAAVLSGRRNGHSDAGMKHACHPAAEGGCIEDRTGPEACQDVGHDAGVAAEAI